MAATAYKYNEETDERAPLRLVPGGRPQPGRVTTERIARDARRRQDARPFRRVFTAVVAVCVMLVILGLGPVFLSAQATRDSQQSVLIQESLDSANARAEQLEMRRSVLTSSLRVNTIATNQLGMVPATGGQMTVELSSAKPRVAATTAAQKTALPSAGKAMPSSKNTSGSRASVNKLARLTAGQAGALLVGDVGLAAAR